MCYRLGVQSIFVASKNKWIYVSDALVSRKIITNDKLFKPGLFRIILGFLADPSIGMSIEKRHGLVQCLLEAWLGMS